MTRSQHQLRDYIDTHFAPEDALLQQVRAAGEARREGMQISAAEGKLLWLLARMIGAKRILEIGCFMGYSSIWLARALPRDDPAAQLITLEANRDYAALAQTHFQAASLPIQLHLGAALDIIPQLEGLFDMIFIDADKANYDRYLERTLPLLREGGLMIGDNTLLFGAMLGAPMQKVSHAAITAMQHFNARMNDGKPLSGILIPTDEGLTVAIKQTASL
jgi:predicted O-methyltransferase YrrM